MRLAAGLMMAALALPMAARAQDQAGDIAPPSSDEWNVTIATYGWLAGVSGPAQVSDDVTDPLPEIDSDSNGFFDNLDFFGFAVGEVSKGSVGGLVDVAYVSLTFDNDLRLRDAGPVLLSGELGLKAAVTTVEGFYRFEPAEDVEIDALAGVRVFWIDMDLDVDGPLGGSLFQAQAEDTWADVVIGGRVRWTPGRWRLSAQGDFGAGSDTSNWGIILLADYRVTEHFGVMGGYRWLEFDYGKGDRDMDLTLDGPLFGVTWTF